MVGLLDKLRINIIEQNLRLEEEIKKIEEEAPNSTEQEINDFIITYNKTGRIDVEKLKLFFDKLDVQNLETIEWYGYAQSLLDYYEKTKISTSSAFSRDINKAQEMIERLIIEINKLREKLFSNIKNVSFRKKELEKNILYLEKIEKLIDNYETSKFMSEDNCDFLFTYLSENKIISEEELCELIKNIVLTNSKILEETIRLETLKRKQALEQERILREQQLKEQKEKELANQAKKEQELIYLEPTPKEKVEISDEYLATFLGESQIRRYNLALSLISNLNNISEKTEVISKTITEKSSWKERLAIYE